MNERWDIKEKDYTTLFVLFLGLILFTRLAVFLGFNLVVIDTDQPYMWQGASDYAKGLFYEPRYYGQDYNTFMEALLAVPLVLLHVPVYFAVPAATHFISLFPFLFTAFYLFFKRRRAQALLVLAVLLCIPIQYDLLNALPRGFVTGVFFTSFFVVSILSPQNMLFVLINSAMAVIGYFVNPNSILASAPFLFFLFLSNYSNRRYYFYTGAGLLFFLPAYVFFNGFYLRHPDYVMLPLDNVFSFRYFWSNLSSLDARFVHISFFLEKGCLFLLLSLAVIWVALYRQNKNGFWAMALFVGLLLFSLCFSKIGDGSPWVFASNSRMFLGIPILVTLFVAMLQVRLKGALNLLCLIPLFYGVFKLSRLEPVIRENGSNAGGVRLHPLKNSLEFIDFYKKMCSDRKVDFVLVSSRFWLNTLLSCGGPSVDPGFPETAETFFEKRYWIREKNRNRIIKKFIYLSSDYNLDLLLPSHPEFELERIDNFGIYLVKNNRLPMGRFIELLNAYEPR